MNQEDVNRITIEYKHDVVEKFAKDFMARKIYLEPIAGMNNPKAVARRYAEIADDVKKYFLNDLRGTELEKLELHMFEYIVNLTITNLIRETTSNDSLDEVLKSISGRMDATDKLLVSILKILNEVSKKIDKLSK